MITDKLSHPIVKAAIDALSKHDEKAWLSLFTSNVRLYDDGNPRDFKSFTKNAVGMNGLRALIKLRMAGWMYLVSSIRMNGEILRPILNFISMVMER